ncbi:MAG: hypothetical protein LBM25_05355 [Bacteroidales bacterium]|jgi:hypothetical protein|nr:hypothetical protein [Bacteroidales bacterium]
MNLKRILFTAFICLSFAFVSCSSDDENGMEILGVNDPSSSNPSNPSQAINISFEDLMSMMDNPIDSADAFLQSKGFTVVDTTEIFASSKFYVSTSLPLHSVWIVGSSVVDNVNMQVVDFSGNIPFNLLKNYLNASSNYSIMYFNSSVNTETEFYSHSELYSYLTTTPATNIHSVNVSYDISPLNTSSENFDTRDLTFGYGNAGFGATFVCSIENENK